MNEHGHIKNSSSLFRNEVDIMVVYTLSGQSGVRSAIKKLDPPAGPRPSKIQPGRARSAGYGAGEERSKQECCADEQRAADAGVPRVRP